MSVWESVEALRAYVYGPEHVAVLRRRREWFERLGSPHLVLWWVPAGHRPDLDGGRRAARPARRDGPTAEAFTLRAPFPAPA